MATYIKKWPVPHNCLLSREKVAEAELEELVLSTLDSFVPTASQSGKYFGVERDSKKTDRSKFIPYYTGRKEKSYVLFDRRLHSNMKEMWLFEPRVLVYHLICQNKCQVWCSIWSAPGKRDSSFSLLRARDFTIKKKERSNHHGGTIARRRKRG